MPDIWYIYYIRKCRHAKPKPKDKFVVIVCNASGLWGFFINTDVRPFVQRQPELSACQVTIKAIDYKCLNHNSYVDCTELYPFEEVELHDIKDPINQQTKAEIKKAVSMSKTIVVRHQKLILAS